MNTDNSTLRAVQSISLSTIMILSVVAMVATGPVGLAAATEGVSDCTVIDSPGSYVLENDVSADQPDEACIEITADGVTFDGGGHTIMGGSDTALTSRGIHVTGASNVTTTVGRSTTPARNCPTAS